MRSRSTQRSSSEPQLLQTRRHVVRDHIGGAIPGYSGFVPGRRTEVETIACTFADEVQAGRQTRARQTFDAVALRQGQEDADRRSRSLVPSARQPAYDSRGNGYAAAGDTLHSRIAVSGEEKAHCHSNMGLTSQAHENLGGAGELRGYGRAAKGIPGYGGYVPGKHSENVYAEGWSKSHEKSLGAHFVARMSQPKKFSVLTEGNTLVPSTSADALREIPLKNPAYNDRISGWSTCEFTGTQVDPAGRLAPRDRQDGFGGVQANINTMTASAAIHGYAGWVPGRVGENVVGERQCKTNAVASHLFNKNRMRITQR
mmetsp:Transcript_44915/g.143892  ORF Transcript_44915/g.143892 Transcript_44915/m.143892 type:complete len:314 (-) Transcript_44915:122-1063(-)|eukprot:CAMPEP_0203870154 /NCGR_PEP_ID=MMETSP0359-20131031/18090_1 /ASSEMBLY_ACC=CAM_ASM_000338 /TAXON_ID=268821 /ORGANISM="Scrippsiella Hangoei, Strain SHTV-5" /LENGTH=313 /DNA_ID=CAMNT_0050788815 /DNA_START=72 /DNA_END=1013 /DNA_ORIENTATION=+